MTHKELKKESKILAKNVQDEIGQECNRLIKSGAIDPSNNNSKEWLPMTIMLVALKNVQRKMKTTEQMKKDILILDEI